MEEKLCLEVDKKFLEYCFSFLNEREKRVVFAYYGFTDNKKRTMEEVALMEGISKMGVERIIKKVLRVIRGICSGEEQVKCCNTTKR